jgi:hypothetical protein
LKKTDTLDAWQPAWGIAPRWLAFLKRRGDGGQGMAVYSKADAWSRWLGAGDGSQGERDMSLFGTHHASRGTIAEVAQMVQTYFRGRGLDFKAREIAGTEGYGWWLNEGSARIYIFVQDAPGGPVVRITSPIVYVPQSKQAEFFKHLLDINASLSCCALATSDDTVLVVAQRHTMQLDQEELDDLIWNVAYVADLLDDKLVTEFGTNRFQS